MYMLLIRRALRSDGDTPNVLMKYYNNTFYDASVDENLDESEMTVECRDTSADSGNQEVVTFCYVRHILQNTALHVVQARSPARLKKCEVARSSYNVHASAESLHNQSHTW